MSFTSILNTLDGLPTIQEAVFSVEGYVTHLLKVTKSALNLDASPAIEKYSYIFAVTFFLLASSLLWSCCRPRKGQDSQVFGGQSQTPERLKVFAKWAQQQVEDSPPDAHRQILDDVIYTFATYAQRLDQDPSLEVRQAALTRMRVLAELLEVPRINAALRDVNWVWLRDWERKSLDSREARIRCMTVFPTICAAARAQQAARSSGFLRKNSGTASLSPQSLSYLAAWCADFLERTDVRASLGFSAERGLSTSSGVNFLSAGALYSDSEEEDDPSPGGRTGNGSESCVADEVSTSGGDYLDFSRQEHEGQVHTWSEPDATQALVRGPDYLVDHHKVPSKPAMLELVEVDLVKTNDEMVHYSISSRGKVPKLREAGDDRFFFVLNFRLVPIQLAVIWAWPKDADWKDSPEGRLLQKYIDMTPEQRSTRLKVLPKVTEGPWLVKKGVPDRPGVVGKKLKCDNFRGEDHLEVSINCISAAAGRRLVQLLTGAASLFSMELFLILEGQSRQELPERVLGGLAVHHGNLGKLRPR
mmetsp:Transcript_53633/g.114523  ORF Transcript_53633/g.114523 Transcript_53633/m.114523 type:complete len:530 (-) Transcript_53633:36-1625(-)